MGKDFGKPLKKNQVQINIPVGRSEFDVKVFERFQRVQKDFGMLYPEKMTYAKFLDKLLDLGEKHFAEKVRTEIKQRGY